jgi:hypothetical protein
LSEYMIVLRVMHTWLTRRWVREFMNFPGQVMVANYLANMCRKGIKGSIETELEMELLKFFKKSLSNKVCCVMRDCD